MASNDIAVEPSGSSVSLRILRRYCFTSDAKPTAYRCEELALKLRSFVG